MRPQWVLFFAAVVTAITVVFYVEDGFLHRMRGSIAQSTVLNGSLTEQSRVASILAPHFQASRFFKVQDGPHITEFNQMVNTLYPLPKVTEIDYGWPKQHGSLFPLVWQGKEVPRNASYVTQLKVHQRQRKYLCILDVVDEIPVRNNDWITNVLTLFKKVCEFAIVGQNPPIVADVLLIANGSRCLWGSLGRDYDAIIAIDSAATFDRGFSPEAFMELFEGHRPWIATAGNTTALRLQLESFGFFVIDPEFFMWYCMELTMGIGMWGDAPDGHFPRYGQAVSTLWNRNLGEVWCSLAASFSKDRARPPCVSFAVSGVSRSWVTWAMDPKNDKFTDGENLPVAKTYLQPIKEGGFAEFLVDANATDWDPSLPRTANVAAAIPKTVTEIPSQAQNAVIALFFMVADSLNSCKIWDAFFATEKARGRDPRFVMFVHQSVEPNPPWQCHLDFVRIPHTRSSWISTVRMNVHAMRFILNHTAPRITHFFMMTENSIPFKGPDEMYRIIVSSGRSQFCAMDMLHAWWRRVNIRWGAGVSSTASGLRRFYKTDGSAILVRKDMEIIAREEEHSKELDRGYETEWWFLATLKQHSSEVIVRSKFNVFDECEAWYSPTDYPWVKCGHCFATSSLGGLWSKEQVAAVSENQLRFWLQHPQIFCGRKFNFLTRVFPSGEFVESWLIRNLHLQTGEE